MNSFLNPRPEKRKFKYKPRYHEANEEKRNREENFDIDQFADKIHRSWSGKRSSRSRNTFPLRTFIWLLFIVFVLVFFFYKFMN